MDNTTNSIDTSNQVLLTAANNGRDTTFTILKAIAIICVVLSHAGLSGWLYRFVFIFHVPVFFLCAGYFFQTKYLSDGSTFLKHRIRGLYLPFVRWSLFFLVIHNLCFYFGILSENYGNAQGGVLHPYSWHQFCQNLWSIVLNMSSYDEFLGGSFWFFRSLFVASIAFWLLFKLLRHISPKQSDKNAAWCLVSVAFLLTMWKVAENIRIPGLVAGGYRELMATTFIAAGFLIRQYDITKYISWKIAILSFLLLAFAATFFPSSMACAPSFKEFISLPFPAVAAFLALIYACKYIDGTKNVIKNALIFIGDRTLYIFAFHLFAFKIVSAVKVAWYGLPWETVGSHPIVHTPANNVLWTLLYLIVGVGVPLGWITVYRRVAKHINIDKQQILDFCILVGKQIQRIVIIATKVIGRLLVSAYRSILQGVKDIMAASSTKEE